MDSTIPLLVKAINYINNPTDKNKKQKFMKELTLSKSSLIAFYSYGVLLNMAEQYKGNETYDKVIKMFEEQIYKTEPKNDYYFDEKVRKLKKVK